MSKELFARVSPLVASFQMTVEKTQPKELLRPMAQLKTSSSALLLALL